MAIILQLNMWEYNGHDYITTAHCVLSQYWKKTPSSPPLYTDEKMNSTIQMYDFIQKMFSSLFFFFFL